VGQVKKMKKTDQNQVLVQKMKTKKIKRKRVKKLIKMIKEKKAVGIKQNQN